MIRIPKDWGYEEVLCNTSQYCGKALHVRRGEHCSFHFHKIKDETFYVWAGRLLILSSWSDCLDQSGRFVEWHAHLSRRVYFPGESIHILPRMRHLFHGLDDVNIIMETSTHHEDSDSYRVLPGREIQLNVTAAEERAASQTVPVPA